MLITSGQKYYSLLYPDLTYNIILCYVHSSKLITMQKESGRIITGVHCRAHTVQVFKHLHFFELADLYQLQVNRYSLSFLKGLLPSSFKDTFTISSNQHYHSTRHSILYKLIAQNTNGSFN